MGPSNSAVKPTVTRTEMPGISPAQARAQLQKILDDALFTRTQRMSRFLRFGVEHALAGTGHEVKEYLVGVDVFDRPKDYDPRVDPIVRVEARRLRSKLRSYYASSGKKDELIIDFPKGAYAAAFEWRSSAKSVVPSTVPAAETSIAVLPFSNLSPGPAQGVDHDYFSDGLTEELILHLTRVKGLRVVAWYSASKFRGREEDLSLIREQLKVGVVLRGSVRQTGSRVRVTVQLIDAASGAFLWADAFERGMHDMVAIQQGIAHSIVATLRPALGAKDEAPPTLPKLNPECYSLCLQGRFHANRRNAEGLERSVLCYQQAIEKDPESASAHAGLADAYSLLADYGIVHPHEVMPRAESSARRALELDQNSAEVFTSLAHHPLSFRLELDRRRGSLSPRHRAQSELCEGSSLVWYRSACDLGTDG